MLVVVSKYHQHTVSSVLLSLYIYSVVIIVHDQKKKKEKGLSNNVLFNRFCQRYIHSLMIYAQTALESPAVLLFLRGAHFHERRPHSFWFSPLL